MRWNPCKKRPENVNCSTYLPMATQLFSFSLNSVPSISNCHTETETALQSNMSKVIFSKHLGNSRTAAPILSLTLTLNKH